MSLFDTDAIDASENDDIPRDLAILTKSIMDGVTDQLTNRPMDGHSHQKNSLWFYINPNSHGLLNGLFPTGGGGADSARALGTIVDGRPFLPNCA